MPSLTIWETVSFAAKTRSPRNISKDKLYGLIASIISDLGLSNKVHSLVSSLSGGELRRLALATELVCQVNYDIKKFQNLFLNRVFSRIFFF